MTEQKKIDELKNSIRTIPNFPKSGIMFRDITSLLKNPSAFNTSIEILIEKTQHLKFDYIAGIESRGFIFGAALALRLNKGFIPIRKKGKLPGKVLRQEYQLEYGTDIIEVHVDDIEAGKKYLLIDDLLATGGTAIAGMKLLQQANAQVVASAFVVDLPELNGKKKLEELGLPVITLVEFGGH